MTREEREKREYKEDVKNLLNKPIRNSMDMNLALGYLKAIELFCRLSNWNIIEILGGEVNAGEDNCEVENFRYAPFYV